MSPRWIGAPLRYVTTSRRNDAALSSWPFACTVYVLVGPFSTPVGRLTFWSLTASATSSMPICRLASAFGSSWMRTAYFADPYTFTCATPGIIEMRCAMNVSAYLSSSEIGISVDVNP